MALVNRVDDASLPPKPLRRANHYWRINSTKGAGYVLVVSDQLPMCHITGGGNVDLQPTVEWVLTSKDFQRHWSQKSSSSAGNMTSTAFESLLDPKLSIIVSRASRPNDHLDRVQVIATATYKLDN